MVGIQRAHPLSYGGKSAQPLGPLDLDFWVLVSSGRFQVPTRKDTTHGELVSKGMAACGDGVPEAGRTCRAACQVLLELEGTHYMSPFPASHSSTGQKTLGRRCKCLFSRGQEAVWVRSEHC